MTIKGFRQKGNYKIELKEEIKIKGSRITYQRNPASIAAEERRDSMELKILVG